MRGPLTLYERPDMAQWMIQGRFTFTGEAIVEAESAEDANRKFDEGDLELMMPAASMIDWERRGEPKEDK